MTYRKMLGLAAAAALALTAFASSTASATALYNGTTKLVSGSVIDFNLLSGGKLKLADPEGGVLNECSSSTLKSKLNTGITSTIESLTYGSCSFQATTVTLGKLEFEWVNFTEGKILSDAEIAVTYKHPIFTSCTYGVENGVVLGTLTTFATNAAIFHVNVVTKRLANPACPATARWTGTYLSSEPTNLRIEQS